MKGEASYQRGEEAFELFLDRLLAVTVVVRGSFFFFAS